MSRASTPRIDAHQHYWTLSRGDYGWLRPEMVPIHRDFTPADLDPLLREADIAGTIVVQAAPTEAETCYLLALAAGCRSILGVVGWSDLEATDAPARIHALAADPLLVGLRPMVHDIADDDWLLRPTLGPAVAEMQAQGLVFDALVRPHHLSRLIRFAEAHPGLSVVIDHLAKPAIVAGPEGPGWEVWARDMAVLAAMPQVSCKLSGIVTEAGADWDVAQLCPFAKLALDLFGPRRLLWGSDWPVLRLVSSYSQWWQATTTLLAMQPQTACDAILGGNAARIYLSRRGRSPY
ncbi:MAG TPA: amidohydrolase family protein [Roseomonas sp.]|nr:amidohydrolase family protein [Roseomonas sp.]